MRIGTFDFDGGRGRVGIVLAEGQVLDVEAALAAEVVANGATRARALAAGEARHWWLTSPGRALLRDLLSIGEGGGARQFVHPLDDIGIHPPVPEPGKIIAAGRNYLDHVEEGKRLWAARGHVVERPPFPSGFFKVTSALVPDGADIEIPAGIDTVDYEIELAVVIGEYARDVAVQDALDHVAGYTVANDVAARSVQLAEMEQLGLLVSKNFPTFAPLGPWITTADEVGDPQVLTMTLWVGEEVRQQASTADMLFSVAELVADWSRIGLEPGDIVLTGTPSGVALSRPDPDSFYLRAGDVVTAEISGVGRLRNPVRNASASERVATVSSSRSSS